MKKYITTIILLVVFCSESSLLAQVKDEPINEIVKDYADTNLVFISVEQQPEFPGGEAELTKYLQQNVHYPIDELKKKITGIVYVYFVIGRYGQVKDAKVLRGVKGGEGLNKEAI